MPILEETFPLLDQLPDEEEAHQITKLFCQLPDSSIELGVSAIVEELRNLLRPVLAEPEHAYIAHKLLLLLAEYSPLNTVDPITFDPIQPEDAVYISTGAQFSLTALVISHYHRPYWGDSEWGETPVSKWLINPITNNKFSVLDEAHIIESAGSIEDLKRQIPFDLQQEFDLAQDEQQVWEEGTFESEPSTLASDQGSLTSEQATLERRAPQHGLFRFFRFLCGGCCGAREEPASRPPSP